MAAIRPSWVGSGKGWCHKMHIRPEYNFGLLDQMARRHSFLRFGPIYGILVTKMAAVRPSWIGSGKGWWRKMRIRPAHNFGPHGQMARQHSF